MRDVEEGTVIVGRILGAHGIRGEVSAQSAGLSEKNESNFSRYESLWVESDDGEGKWFHVAGVKKAGSGIVIKLDGVDDRSCAESLRGSVLKVKKEQCRPLREGSYYVFDLVGLDVQTVNSRRIGKIKDVMTMPAQDVLVVDSNGKEILIPAVKAFIKNVDLGTRVVIIDPIEGMLDGNVD